MGEFVCMYVSVCVEMSMFIWLYSLSCNYHHVHICVFRKCIDYQKVWKLYKYRAFKNSIRSMISIIQITWLLYRMYIWNSYCTFGLFLLLTSCYLADTLFCFKRYILIIKLRRIITLFYHWFYFKGLLE